MKVLITQSNSFLGKNLIENLKNIRDGKNRIRPGNSIGIIYEDKCDTADFVFVLLGDKDYDKIKRIMLKNKNVRFVYISSLKGSENEELFLTKPDTCYVCRCPDIAGKWQVDEGKNVSLCRAVANDEEVVIGE